MYIAFDTSSVSMDGLDGFKDSPWNPMSKVRWDTPCPLSTPDMASFALLVFRYLERFVSLVYLPNELVYVSLIDDACSNEIHYYNLIFNVSNNTLS